MNAKRLIVTMVFATILIGFFIWIIGVFIDDAGRKNRIWREQSGKVNAAIEYIKAENYDIMYYGEDLNGPKAFTPRHIYNFDYDSITGEGEAPEGHVGHVIILNDLNADLRIEKEDWFRLLTLLRYENYVIVYLGSDKLPEMQKEGFFFDVYPETTNSIVFWNSGREKEIGFADDPTVIPEVVREGLTQQQCTVYAMIMKMQSHHYI